MNRIIVIAIICLALAAGVLLISHLSSPPNEALPSVRWIDAETHQVLFTLDDIVRFDWDKQLFELRPSRAAYLSALPRRLRRDFVITDGKAEIYRGCFFRQESSMSYDGPTIPVGAIFPTDVEPPLYRIEVGYGEYRESSSRSKDRFHPRLRAALHAACLLTTIHPPQPEHTPSTDSKGNPPVSVPDVRSQDAERLFNIEEIVSPIPPGPDQTDPLQLEWIFSEPFVNFSQLYVTVHKGKARPDRLALYFCENGKYQLLKTIEADGICSGFDKPNFFHYDFDSTTRETFLHVPMRYHGTGGFRKDRVFCCDLGLQAEVIEVDFEPAPEALVAYLNEGERPTSYAYCDFTDNSLRFAFYVLGPGDHYKHPTAGYISGTYKITKTRHANLGIKKRTGSSPIQLILDWPTKYEMRVDNWQREPVKRDRYGFTVWNRP